MRIWLSILLLLLFIPGYSGDAPRRAYGPRPAMQAQRVALYPADPGRTDLGALTYLGGVRLTSADPAFGGFSSMVVQGDRFTLLSDGGVAARFRMDGDFRVSDVVFEDLPDGPGGGWLKRDRDSESMTIDPATGRLWVGFENANAIWRYGPGLSEAQAHSAPRTMADWPINVGAEGMIRLRDGRFAVFGEPAASANGRDRACVMFAGDPTEKPDSVFRFAYRPPAVAGTSMATTDVTQLPDGNLLVLARGIRRPLRFVATVALVRLDSIRPGAVVGGPVIAQLESPTLADNFEAIAVTRENGQVIVWLATDDNQSFLEQTLLLKFRLDMGKLALAEGKAAPAGGRPAQRLRRPRPPSSPLRASDGAHAARDPRHGS